MITKTITVLASSLLFSALLLFASFQGRPIIPEAKGSITICTNEDLWEVERQIREAEISYVCLEFEKNENYEENKIRMYPSKEERIITPIFTAVFAVIVLGIDSLLKRLVNKAKTVQQGN